VFYHVGFFLSLVPMTERLEDGAGNAANRRREQPGRPNAAASLMGDRSFEEWLKGFYHGCFAPHSGKLSMSIPVDQPLPRG